MAFEKEFEEALKRVIEKAVEKSLKIVIGIAIDIDENKRLFTLQREGMDDIEEVRMNAVAIEKNECTIIPKVGSAVTVVFVDGEKVGVMVNCSEVEKINLVIGKTKLMVTADGVNIETEKMKMKVANEDIIFNGGENKGLVRIEKMVDWMGKVYQDLQTLKSQLSTHAVAGQGAPLGIVFNPTVANPQISTFENNKIKH